MSAQSPLQFLTGFKVLHGALSTLLALLSATLIRDRLIPYQLSVIGAVGALFILVALFITLAFQDRLKKYISIFIGVSLATLVLLTLLQIYVVTTVENYGEPPGTHHFLVGYSLTEQGQQWMKEIGSGRPDITISNVGYKRIPVMYGSSYYVSAVVYSFTYLLFMVAVVLSLGGILTLSRIAAQENSGGREAAPTPEAPPPSASNADETGETTKK